PSHIVISPGPCDPDKAGMSIDIVNYFQGLIPILGVCLGHQTIGQVFGAKVVQASQVVHGKVSPIYHNNHGVFQGLPAPYMATRYHSLVIDKESLPSCLQVTAWTENNQGELQYIMGIKHKSLPIEGIQFHPESVLSEHGIQLLQNFIG
ncbi:MAG: aminodeoxychorismate/anthranilate synthase component II, partial [Kangiellaceae bacterium]|nr:aminodeoxychorismate/anthranilate synthase component II [Kangiellaceae bacterium]